VPQQILKSGYEPAVESVLNKMKKIFWKSFWDKSHNWRCPVHSVVGLERTRNWRRKKKQYL